MNLIDIEAYTRKSIPTESISNELLIKPQPPVKMKSGRLKPGARGGKPGRGGKPVGGKGGNQQRPRRRKGGPRQQNQPDKQAG